MPPAFTAYFADLPDPRVARTRRHPLMNLLLIALCAFLSGAEGWEDIEAFGKAKEHWLTQHLGLDLSSGIPHHDTFRRVFARLDPTAFSACFLAWTQAIAVHTKGEVIALDGKTLRHSFDKVLGTPAAHIVSAWAAGNRLCLGQVKVDDKSNEITAIPALLSLLELSGCIVTCDAMGCQKAIAAQIVAQGGEYVLALKDNHPRLHEEVETLFVWAATEEGKAQVDVAFCQSRSYGHGRQETRRCWSIKDVSWLDQSEETAHWAKLSSVACIENERRVGNKVSVERRYFLCSLPGSAKRILRAVRRHWGIENRLHWVLDVVWREDECRVRRDYGAQNLATLRHLAMNLLSQEQSQKQSMRRKRKRAAWEEDYLLQILAGQERI